MQCGVAGSVQSGDIRTKDGFRLHYDEYGTGERHILSAQVGFYPSGIQQALAEKGYHVWCLTLRGFAPSDYVTEELTEEADRFLARAARNGKWYTPADDGGH